MPPFRKGSPEAKAYMAKLRAMRGKGSCRGGKKLTKKQMERLIGSGLLTLPFKPLKWGVKLGAKGLKHLIKAIIKKKEGNSGSGAIEDLKDRLRWERMQRPGGNWREQYDHVHPHAKEEKYRKLLEKIRPSLKKPPDHIDYISGKGMYSGIYKKFLRLSTARRK